MNYEPRTMNYEGGSRGNPQSFIGASAHARMNTTKAYLRHAIVWAGLSGQRRFVPRASTRLTTKLCLPAQKMAVQAMLADAVRAQKIAPLQGLRVSFDAGANTVGALWGSPLQGLRVSFDAAADAVRALWGSPLRGWRVSFDAAGQAVRALWGSPLQGLRVSFDAGRAQKLRLKVRRGACF
jgi:hypothetical protein